MRRFLVPAIALLTALFTLAGPMASMPASASDRCASEQSAGLKTTCCGGECCIAGAPQPFAPGALPEASAQWVAPPAEAVVIPVRDLAQAELGSIPVLLFARSPDRTLSLLQSYLL